MSVGLPSKANNSLKCTTLILAASCAKYGKIGIMFCLFWMRHQYGSRSHELFRNQSCSFNVTSTKSVMLIMFQLYLFFFLFQRVGHHLEYGELLRSFIRIYRSIFSHILYLCQPTFSATVGISVQLTLWYLEDMNIACLDPESG
jgi:hypothetical protein